MDNVNISLSEFHHKLIMWTLLCLMPIVGMAVDLISPSLPSISSSLDESTSIVQNVISIYLLGYAFGNFCTGFLTDAFGRKKLLLIGMIGFIAASLLPVFVARIDVLLFSRLLQGLTIGTIAVIARAIFSDILPPERLVKMGVLIGSMFGLGPIIGPFIGGYLQDYYGWQSCFVFFSASMLLMFLLISFIVPETHFNRHALNFKTIKKNQAEILRNRKFMGMVIMMGTVYSLAIAFNTVGPFLIQTRFNHTAIFFGHVALCMGFSFLISTLICGRLLSKFKAEKLFLIAVNGFLTISVFALGLGYVFPESVVFLCGVSALMFFAEGFIFPMSMGCGLAMFRHIAGTAVAYMYLINILMTSAMAFLLSCMGIEDPVSLFWVYLILMIICSVSYWALVHEKLEE